MPLALEEEAGFRVAGVEQHLQGVFVPVANALGNVSIAADDDRDVTGEHLVEDRLAGIHLRYWFVYAAGVQFHGDARAGNGDVIPNRTVEKT